LVIIVVTYSGIVTNVAPDFEEDIRHGGDVHRMAGAKKIEFIGISILRRHWALVHPDWAILDVHSDSRYFRRGIDLILQSPGSGSQITADAKVDTYIGSDRSRKVRGLCNPDSGVLLIETLSQLQYDRQEKDIRGWFLTSEADEIHYYYLALLNSPEELDPFFAEVRQLNNDGASTTTTEERLIRSLRVDRDLLLTYKLSEARAWFEDPPEAALRGYSGATNPTYVTVSVRVDRSYFCKRGPGRMVGPIFEAVRQSIGD
jgi:hypothetical protein